MGEWFEEWFGEEYLELYPHRDDRDADRLIDLIERTLAPAAGARVLDLCCGAGRHARALAGRGCRVVGVDLSRHLLLRARATAHVPLVRSDVRELPFRSAAVDVAVNLFTSFGYFDSDEAHRDALAEMVRPVRAGGWFVIDFLNAAHVTAALVARETTDTAAGPVVVERWLDPDGRYVRKTITTPHGRQFMERVRLLTEPDLDGMLAVAGATVRHRFGSYGGDPIGPQHPRVILFAQVA